VTNAVDITNASKVFNPGTTRQVDALVDVDLVVGPGEFVSLIGPSGCGKSTLLRLIANLIEPTTGDVRVNGKPARQARLDQEYGMAFQQAGLFEWRNVVKNVELPLELKGWDKAKRRQRAMEMLELVKLHDFAEHRPWQLSGGMQQRVAIARALAYQPQILLMDEPFASVDAQTRADLEDLILDVRERYEPTIVFVTHDIDESVYLSDRIVVLSPSPTSVREILEVDLPRPRDQVETKELPEFARLRAHVYRLIKREEARLAR
jgi:NitT/TauT family transport system ATP-binding protein